MTAVGFAYFLSALTSADDDLVFTIGLLLANVFLIVALHMVLAFPTGHLATRGLRRLVAISYAASILLQLGFMLVTPDPCPECSPSTPDNLFAVTDNGTASDIVLILASVVATGILAASATVLVRRWRAATTPARRALGPVLFTGLALLAALTALFAIQAVDSSGPVVDAAGIPAMLAFAALPFAFLAGLLRNRWSRAGAVGELVERLGVERASLTETLADAMGDPTSAGLLAAASRSASSTAPAAPSRCPATAIRRARRRWSSATASASARSSTTAASARSPSCPARSRRRGARDGERAPGGRAARAAGGAAGVARPAHRDRPGRAPASRARPARRRPAAPRRAVAAGCARAREAHERSRAAGAILDRARDELRRAPRGAARAGARHPPGRAHRPRARRGDRRASPRGARAGRAAVDAAERLPTAVEAAAYFVVAESLTNMAKYARRVARDACASRAQNGIAVVEVRDDGSAARRRRAAPGCAGLADRSRRLDGRLEVVSPPGDGHHRPSEDPMRVVVAEDSVLLREGVVRLLQEAGHRRRRPGRRRGGPAAQGRAPTSPTSRVVDIRMPPTQTDEGLRAAATIRAEQPQTGVLVLSQYVEEAYALELLADNAEGVGYLLKDRVADVERFVDACGGSGKAARRSIPRSSHACSAAVGGRTRCRRSRPREREVLGTMAEGRSNHGIAEALVVTERAVEKHVTSIFTQARTCPRPRTTIAACSPC